MSGIFDVIAEEEMKRSKSMTRTDYHAALLIAFHCCENLSSKPGEPAQQRK
uniref:Phage protein n=1 Tax=Meloidogyne hapla TaxID=6305 RepID=A0A1I8BST3_MELHA